MATVENTIILRDRMSNVIDQISNRMRRMGQESSSAGNQAERGMSNAARGASSLTSTLGHLGGKIFLVNEALDFMKRAFEGAKGMAEVADQYTQIDARLSLIAQKGQTVADLQNQIYAAAERSRGSYTAMAGGVAKMAQLAHDAFKSNQEVIAFTELLQKSYIVGGAAAEEQAAGIYQITQALAAGKLQGDEFRSVLETSPLFAQAISNYTGKSMGELKKMSAAGTISADIMKNAMFKAAEDINSKFATMPMTFGQAWQIASDKAVRSLQPLMDRFSKWINQGGDSKIEAMLNGIASAALVVGNAIFWAIDNFKLVSSIAVGVGAAVAIASGAFTVLTYQIWLASAAALGLSTAMATATFGLSIIIGAAVAGIAYWIQSVGGLKNAWALTMEEMIYLWDYTKIAFVKTGYAIWDFFDALNAGVLSAMQFMINGVIQELNGLIELINKIPGINIGTISAGTTMGDDAINKLKTNFASREATTNGMVQQAEDDANQRRLVREYTQYSNARKDSAASASASQMNVPTGTPSDPINTKVQGTVKIDEEDLRFMRDIARVKFINQYTTLRPSVKAVFGDIRESADVNKIVQHLADIMENSTSSALS